MFGQNTFKRRIATCASACLLSVCLIVTMSPAAFAAAGGSTATGTSFIKGEFSFSPHLVYGQDLTDNFIYSDDYFSGSGYEYNSHLATMSMILAASSISSQEEDYANKSANVADLLTKLKFTRCRRKAPTLRYGDTRRRACFY